MSSEETGAGLAKASILVLGGSYFLGRAIAASLHAAGAEVICLNRGSRRPEPGTRQIVCDRGDPVALRASLTGAFDVIVDVSAYRPVEVAGVLDALARPPTKYVFISSAAVYDDARASVPFREEDPSGGSRIWGDYGVDKARCEDLLSSRLGQSLFILRPPYVYGPNNYLQRERFIWSRLLQQKPVFVPERGETRVQFMFVETLAAFVTQIALALDVPAGTYNVGESSAYSFNEWIETLASVANTAASIRYVSDPDIPARAYFPFRNSGLTLDVSRFDSIARDRGPLLQSGSALTLASMQGTVDPYAPTAWEKVWLG
ncbi:NAD-dependent epimerase/dehydratase family protein [Bradyrhizobium sp. 2TAF24]|uniref:NAD-dependent epimerase/dehydratase family protein n=1 Tax=Bradyrhizobium sp. 2TAF24 TaxID=3233011 RepID=UPI003F93DF71